MAGPGAVTRALRCAASVLGALSALAGSALIAGYVWWAVIERLGEGDQSLLFWYSPALLVGIGVLAVGLVAMDWGRRGLRRP